MTIVLALTPDVFSHLHVAPLCLAMSAGGAVCPAAARRQITVVLLLKLGAQKVSVVGETTTLELEGGAVFRQNIKPVNLS